MPDLDVKVMFADSGQGTLRTLPLNIGNTVTVLFEMTETTQELTFAGVPSPGEGETTHEMLTGLIEYLFESVKSDELKESLDNGDKENN